MPSFYKSHLLTISLHLLLHPSLHPSIPPSPCRFVTHSCVGDYSDRFTLSHPIFPLHPSSLHHFIHSIRHSHAISDSTSPALPHTHTHTLSIYVHRLTLIWAPQCVSGWKAHDKHRRMWCGYLLNNCLQDLIENNAAKNKSSRLSPTHVRCVGILSFSA